jgi:Tfp pilus assembly protein PilF
MQRNLERVWTQMNWRRSVCVLLLLVLGGMLAGCHSDPNRRKQRYLESGKRYSAEGKYREAAIQFSNALKVDKGYPDAHYELAQAYLHLGQFGPAYSELSRTIELQPTNSKVRIDLGNLLVAAGKTDDAQKQADAVMAARGHGSAGQRR